MESANQSFESDSMNRVQRIVARLGAAARQTLGLREPIDESNEAMSQREFERIVLRDTAPVLDEKRKS
jgi:hypothetical protein